MNLPQDPPIDWSALVDTPASDFPEWVELTPERVALLSLVDCVEQLQKSKKAPLRLALAAKSAHLALQAALTAALAGPANIGAHPEKLRRERLKFLEECRTNEAAVAPQSERVMGFPDLLAAARTMPLPWSSAPLDASPEEVALMERLTLIRHDVEHPKQALSAIERTYILETLPVATALAFKLLDTVEHHFEPNQMDMIRLLAAEIAAMSSTPPPG